MELARAHTQVLAITLNSPTHTQTYRGERESLMWDCIDKSAAALWRLTGYNAPSLSTTTLQILSHTAHKIQVHTHSLSRALECDVDPGVLTIPVQTLPSTGKHCCLIPGKAAIWLTASDLALLLASHHNLSLSLSPKHHLRTFTSTHSANLSTVSFYP